MSDEDYYTLLAMKKYGGSFVKSLSDSGFAADTDNLEKLKHAFPEYWEEYRRISKEKKANG